MYIIDTINDGKITHICDNCNHTVDKLYRKGSVCCCPHCHQPVLASVLDFAHSDKKAKLLRDVQTNRIVLYFDGLHSYTLNQTDISDLPYDMLRAIVPAIVYRFPEREDWDYIFWTEDQLPNQLKPRNPVPVQVKQAPIDANTDKIKKEDNDAPGSIKNCINRRITLVLHDMMNQTCQHRLKSYMPVNRYRTQLINQMISDNADTISVDSVNNMPNDQFIAAMTNAISKVMTQMYPSIKPWFDNNCNCNAELICSHLHHKMPYVNNLIAHMDILTGEITLFVKTDDTENGLIPVKTPFLTNDPEVMMLNLRIPAVPGLSEPNMPRHITRTVAVIPYGQDLSIEYAKSISPQTYVIDTDTLLTWISIGYAPSETSMSIIDTVSGMTIFDSFPSKALNKMLQTLNIVKNNTVVRQFGKDETLTIKPLLMAQTNKPGDKPVALGMLD